MPKGFVGIANFDKDDDSLVLLLLLRYSIKNSKYTLYVGYPSFFADFVHRLPSASSVAHHDGTRTVFACGFDRSVSSSSGLQKAGGSSSFRIKNPKKIQLSRAPNIQESRWHKKFKRAGGIDDDD